MTKTQRYKYETLVRVRNFGAEHQALFPEGSAVVGKFTQVASLVGAIETHLKNRALGTAGSRGVKASTREAVRRYLKTIAKVGRRVTGAERNKNPFRLPHRRNLAALIATARAFLEEAARRQDRFVEFGLPPTFISDLAALVSELEGAQSTHLDGKTMRANAQAGITTSVREGAAIVRDLDVLMELAPQVDEVLTATWKAASRVEGQSSSSAPPKTGEPDGEDQQPAGSPVTSDAANPSAPAVTAGRVTTVEAPVLVLEKAS
jgi:hypothetical protein